MINVIRVETKDGLLSCDSCRFDKENMYVIEIGKYNKTVLCHNCSETLIGELQESMKWLEM